MDRFFLIQYLINKNNYKFYLEIGTEKGESFFPIKCRQKVAVDPEFKIKFMDKILWYFKNPYNIRNKFFPMTSEDFFIRKESYLKNNEKPKIVFIDGLHTFEATLNDALNSLKFIKKDGIIILHDCFPPHKAAATFAANMQAAEKESKNIKGWTGEWCGDSWKTMTYLRKKYKGELKALVLNADYGLGVVQFRKNISLDLNVDTNLFNEINKLEYEDLIKNPDQIIGLREKEEYLNL